MKKQIEEKEEPRPTGPKFRSVLPEDFKIRRSTSPMADMLNAAEREKEEQLTQPIPTHPNPSQPIPTTPPATLRDFNRRANSLERTALPSGMFPGTSKKLYDALYLRTRGAVNPTHTIQATKRQLMQWSGIRSKNTIAINLQLLSSIGLIERKLEIGDHEGSIYEVRLPEEALQPNPTQPNPTQPDPTQKLGLDPTQKLGWVGLGNLIENKDTYEFPKTFIKTSEGTDDDEAFAELNKAFRQAVKEITGKTLNASEAAKWKELADLLVTELRIAATRTNISSVPAFLTEHLRRRLWKKDRKQIEAEEQGTQAEVNLNLSMDKSNCPDCGGSGFYYPSGFEAGVAKCRHEKLMNPT
jgi:hypothetical protein